MVNVRSLAVASCLALSLAAPAGAVTVTVLGTNASAWSQVDPAQSTALPAGATWSVAPNVLPQFVAEHGSDAEAAVKWCSWACSPFDPYQFSDSILQSDFDFTQDPFKYRSRVSDGGELDDWWTIPFFVAWQADPRQDEAERVTLSFGQTMTSLQFLWGSPDTGNLIEFLLGDRVVALLSGTQALGDFVKNPGQGAALVSFSDVRFDGLRFSSTAGGFEWANMMATPIPLPPAGLLLLGGLGALGFAARRRREA